MGAAPDQWNHMIKGYLVALQNVLAQIAGACVAGDDRLAVNFLDDRGTLQAGAPLVGQSYERRAVFDPQRFTFLGRFVGIANFSLCPFLILSLRVAFSPTCQQFVMLFDHLAGTSGLYFFGILDRPFARSFPPRFWIFGIARLRIGARARLAEIAKSRSLLAEVIQRQFALATRAAFHEIAGFGIGVDAQRVVLRWVSGTSLTTLSRITAAASRSRVQPAIFWRLRKQTERKNLVTGPAEFIGRRNFRRAGGSQYRVVFSALLLSAFSTPRMQILTAVFSIRWKICEWKDRIATAARLDVGHLNLSILIYPRWILP